ncbi:MAG: hypothetical protein H0T47_20475 [Planctomycetaceae bacterium]|nr:hypothetical protein [Planctomycetaceae bacterium]
MQIERRCAYGLILLLLPGMSHANANGAGDLLAELRGEDKVVEQLYLECSRVVPTEWTESYPRRERLKFTRRNGLYAIEVEFDQVLKDRGSPPPSSGGRGIGGLPSVPLWQYYLFDSEKSASRQVTALEQDAAGIPNKNGPTQIFQHIYSPDDVSETMFIFMPKWLLGRGFSEHLTDLKPGRTDDDGLLHASGSGFFTPSMLGTWRLTLDPDHAMLVRDAEFLRDGENRPMLRVRTSGLLSPESPADPSVEFAAAGQYIQFHGGAESSVDVENHRVLLEMDEGFFERVSEKFDEELPLHSLAADSRGKETIYGTINRESAERVDAPPDRNPWPWMIFLINVGLLGAVLFYWFLHRLRKRPASD